MVILCPILWRIDTHVFYVGMESHIDITGNNAPLGQPRWWLGCNGMASHIGKYFSTKHRVLDQLYPATQAPWCTLGIYNFLGCVLKHDAWMFESTELEPLKHGSSVANSSNTYLEKYYFSIKIETYSVKSRVQYHFKIYTKLCWCHVKGQFIVRFYYK